jgi:hypothetical protein
MRSLKIALISASRIKSCRSSVPAAHTYDEIGFKYRGVSTSPRSATHSVLAAILSYSSAKSRSIVSNPILSR